MITVALVSDLHGNAVALDAVLADIQAHGADHVVCLGDVAACGPEPERVIERLREIDCACVLGNTDEWLRGRLLPQPHQRDYGPLMELIEWGANAVSDDARRYLQALPSQWELGRDHQQRLLCFHGSPRSSVEGILAETPAEELVDMLAPLPALAYACGHTHLQLLRRVGSAVLVNPGSVGVALARDGVPPSAPSPFAEYAIVTFRDGVADAEMRRVGVDVAAAVRAARASGMPHRDAWAAILGRRVTRSNERARRDATA